jgi:T5SS/PEP-CTERM-associated repeat protein
MPLAKRTSRPRAKLTAAVAAASTVALVVFSPAATARGGTAEVRSNYMGSIWSGWNNATNWAAVTPYSVDPGSLGGDINYVSMAHDDTSLYINFNQGSTFPYDYGSQNIYFDTNLNPGYESNGVHLNDKDYWWWVTDTNIGFEHAMYGSAIFHHADDFWSGDSVDSWNYYGTTDVLIKINLLKLQEGGSAPTSFNWVARYFGIDDYYPNTPDYNRYDITSFGANTLDWNAAAGNFVTAANWNPNAAPNLLDTTTIGNGGTARVDTAGTSAARTAFLNIGTSTGGGTVDVVAGGELLVSNLAWLGIDGGTGTINQTGGFVRIGLQGPGDNDLRLGRHAGSTGIYNLSDGELSVGESLTIGHNGAGHFTMTGGRLTQGGFIVLADNPGTTGTFDLSGGTVEQTGGQLQIGDVGAGTGNFSGGTLSSPLISIGNEATGTGILTISGTADVSSDDDLLIGNNGTGTLNMNGGTISRAGWIVLANNAGSSGTLNMTAGTINQTFGDLEVGDADDGTVNHSGGTINVAHDVIVSNSVGGVGQYSLSGTGELKVANSILIGRSGPGTFTMTGGVISQAGWIVLADNPGTAGTFNLSGGTVNQTFGDVEIGDAGAGVLNQSGGTLNVAGAVLIANQAGSTGDANVSGGVLNAPSIVNKGTLDASGTAVINAGAIGGTGSMSVADTARVNAQHVRQASLAMTGGTVTIADTVTGTAAGVSRLGDYTLTGDARYDLRDNKLIADKSAGTFTGGAYTGVQGDVQRGYNFGAWDQGGLTTSEDHAGQNAGVLSGTTTIGVATASQVLFIEPTDTTVVWGQTVTGATTIAMYTYAGDLNFDGLVDGADYGVIDNSVQFPGTDGYANGDFNYDGVIDGADYGVIDNTIQLQGAPFVGVFNPGASGSAAALSGVTAVPEPSACAFAMLSAATLLARRPRHDRAHPVRGTHGAARG